MLKLLNHLKILKDEERLKDDRFGQRYLVPVIGYIHFSMGLIESFFYVLNNLSQFLEMCIHGHTGFAS